ncbi:RloB family protein [Nocardia brasiliensis]
MSPRTRSTRPKYSKQPKKIQLRVYAEGQVTECNYLTHWQRKYRDTTIVSLADHQETTPRELVERAIRERVRDAQDEKRGRGKAFDEYWCVFDVDDHPFLNDVLATAARSGINIVLSNPCLELWFVLHFKSQTAYLERGQAQKMSEGHTRCRKRLTDDVLLFLEDNYGTAKSRAQALDRKHADDGTESPCNPSSNMWTLIDRIAGA